MTKLTRNLMRIGLLFSLCFSVLFGSCTNIHYYGVEPSGAYYVWDIEVNEEGSKYNGKSYYETYKKEHLYDYSLFDFNSEEKTVTVKKTYDDTMVINGRYEFIYGKQVRFLSLIDLKSTSPKLTITMENGDVLEGESAIFGNPRYEMFTGNVVISLNTSERNVSYYPSYGGGTPEDMEEFLYSDSSNKNILSKMNDYETNKYTQSFRDLYQSFVDRRRLYIYPDYEDEYVILKTSLFSKSEFDLPRFRYTCGTLGNHKIYYYMYVTYLTQELDGLPSDLVDKYKDGGQVWNEEHTEVSFVTEYQHPNFAYSETLLIKVKSVSDNINVEEIANGLTFKVLIGELYPNPYAHFTISNPNVRPALEKQYESLKEVDNLYNGEEIKGTEILNDHIYITREFDEEKWELNYEIGWIYYYRLLKDDSLIAVAKLSKSEAFEQICFYYHGMFYVNNVEQNIAMLYLHLYALENE